MNERDREEMLAQARELLRGIAMLKRLTTEIECMTNETKEELKALKEKYPEMFPPFVDFHSPTP